MRNTNAQNTPAKCIEGILATHGLPFNVRSDNGSQFVYAEYEGFL